MSRKINVNRAKYEVVPETKEPRKGKSVICLTDGNIFKSAKEAADYYGFDYFSVADCCRGQYKTAGGGKGSHGKGLKFSYIADLSYKVNDVSEYIKELKAAAEANAELDTRIEAAKAQLTEMIQRFHNETEVLVASLVG